MYTMKVAVVWLFQKVTSDSFTCAAVMFLYVTGRGGQRQEREGFKDFSKAIYLKLKSISNTATIK